MSWRVCLLVFVIVATGAALLFYKTPEPQKSDATFAGVSLMLDYATDEATQERGLGGRASVPEGYGMLFVFPKDDYYGIWMKDMRAPIDVFWLDANKRVIFMTRDMEPATYPAVFYPSAPARYVLETAAGFAKAHAVATGTELMRKE
jgi:uncharacterized membrane protein (UPF0127 family)